MFLALVIAGVKTWSEVGHMLVAQVALNRLTAANSVVAAKFSSLVLSINSLTDGRTSSFAETACWPDDLKGTQFTAFNMWHYAMSSIIVDPVVPQLNYTEAVQNIYKLISEANKTLRANLDSNSAERAFMGRYLIHMVGDFHQPLHTVDFFNLSFPAGDKGGNLIKVKVPESIDLHSYWDHGMNRFQNNSFVLKRPFSPDNRTAFDSFVAGIEKDFPYNVLQPRATDLNTTNWAKAFFNISRDIIYPELATTNQISTQVADKWYAVARQGVALGGYRLANLVLNIYNATTQRSAL